MNSGNKNESSPNVETGDYQIIFDSSPNMIIYKDINDNILDANKAYIDFVGIPKNQIIGKNTIEVLKNRAIAEATLEDDMEIIKSGKPKMGTIREFTNSFNGKSIWGLVSKVPRFDENGKVIGTISFIVDITERINTEERLKKTTSLFAGRELKMIELKEQIKELTERIEKIENKK